MKHLKVTITQDDLLCLCELSRLYIANRNAPKLFAEESRLVEKLKWFALQSPKPNLTISDTNNKPNIDEI